MYCMHSSNVSTKEYVWLYDSIYVSISQVLTVSKSMVLNMTIGMLMTSLIASPEKWWTLIEPDWTAVACWSRTNLTGGRQFLCAATSSATHFEASRSRPIPPHNFPSQTLSSVEICRDRDALDFFQKVWCTFTKSIPLRTGRVDRSGRRIHN